jgi:hypothetical protein
MLVHFIKASIDKTSSPEFNFFKKKDKIFLVGVEQL